MNLDLGYTKEIIEEALKRGLLRNQLAYVLATAYWETARTMKPVKEAYWLSENWRKKNLRYYPWYGRGFVQITWEANYRKADQKLNLSGSLLKNPDRALEVQIAKQTLIVGMIEGWFTKYKLSDFITLSKSDFKGARKIINGTDKDDEIADIAVEYDSLLKKAGYGNGKPVKAPTETVQPVPVILAPITPEFKDAPVDPSPEPKSLIALIIEILMKLFKKGP